MQAKIKLWMLPPILVIRVKGHGEIRQLISDSKTNYNTLPCATATKYHQ